MSTNDPSSGSPPDGELSAEQSLLARWLEPSPPLPVDDVEGAPPPRRATAELLPEELPADPADRGDLEGEPVATEP
jgi:hypothetical protein